MINFYQFWTWFSHVLSQYNRDNPKKQWLVEVKGVLNKEIIPFSAYRIITIEEKALMRFISKADKESAAEGLAMASSLNNY